MLRSTKQLLGTAALSIVMVSAVPALVSAADGASAIKEGVGVNWVLWEASLWFSFTRVVPRLMFLIEPASCALDQRVIGPASFPLL